MLLGEFGNVIYEFGTMSKSHQVSRIGKGANQSERNDHRIPFVFEHVSILIESQSRPGGRGSGFFNADVLSILGEFSICLQ